MKINRKFIIQFIKFSLVGVLNVIVDWGIFLLLTYFVTFFSVQSHEIYAKMISFVFAIMNSFIFNSIWTFKEEFSAGIKENPEKRLQKIYQFFFKFLTVNLIGLGLNAIIFNLLRPFFGQIFSQFWARIATLAAVTGTVVVWNFIANKYWTFRVKK